MTSPAGSPRWRCSDAELTAGFLRGQEQLAVLQGRLLADLAEMESRGLDHGFGDLVSFQVECVRISQAEARKRLELARALYRTDVSGPPELAATGAALLAGEIGLEHAVEIHRSIRRIPVIQRDGLEDILLDLARVAAPQAVRKAGDHLRSLAEQDTPPDDDGQAHPVREFHSRTDRQGRFRFSGVLDAETGATLTGLFDVLAKPSPANEGMPDLRTRPEREGDALAEMIDLAARTDDLSTQAGERAVVTVTVSLEELERRAGTALITGGGYLSVPALARLCCEATLVPAVFGSEGEVLHLGREARVATKAQRRALALRDKGCSFPGCTRKPRWCVVHHVQEWQHGGKTNVDEMILLCGRHHRIIHHTDWAVTMVAGKPQFHPPAWLDHRRRRPRTNPYHQIPA